MSDKVVISTDFGQKIEATAPIIISASRSTDIPGGFLIAWL